MGGHVQEIVTFGTSPFCGEMVALLVDTSIK